MQINGVTNSLPIPMQKTTTSKAVNVAADQAVINFSPDSFSSLVKEAGQMPEVRSELVDAFKSRIQAGNYPSPDDLAGLVNVIGRSVVQQALSDSSGQ